MANEINVEKQSTRKIALGTILGYLALLVSVASGLLFTPLIKRSLGTSMYGIYTLAISVINLFLIDFGLGTSINAYLSKYRAKGQIEDESRFLTAALKIYLFLDFILLVVFTIVSALIDYIYVGLTSDELVVLRYVFLILTGFSLLTFPSSLYNGILKAYEEFGTIKIAEIVNKFTYVGLTALSLVFNLGIYAVVCSYAISSLINAIILYSFVRIKLKKRIILRQKTTMSDIKEIASFSGYGFLVSLASRLVFTIVPSILGIVSDSTSIAVFGVCGSLEGYVYSFSAVMSGFFMPKISRLTGNRNDKTYIDKLDALAIKVGRIQAAFVLLIIIGFVAVGSDFVDVWMEYDPVYSPVYLGTIVLIIYQIVNVAETIYYTAMSSSKETIKPLAIAYLSISFLNVGLVFLFGYLWGALGACLSICFSHLIEIVTVNALYKKYLGVSLKRFFVRTYFGFLPAVIVSLLAAVLFHLLLPFTPIINFFIGGFCTVIIYCSLAWIGFGYKETKAFFNRLRDSFLSRIKKKKP